MEWARFRRGIGRRPALIVLAGVLMLLAVGVGGCGRNVEMPNVVGLPYGQAQQELRDGGLDVRYVAYVPAPTGVALDTVVRQSPAQGGEVAKDVAITLTLAGKGTATVPDVVGKTQDDAVAALATAGLTAGTVTTMKDAEADPGRVVSQAPDAGTGVPLGSEVDLGVSSSVVVAKVPDVVGVGQEEAKAQLKDVGFSVKTNSAFSERPVGEVVDQAPGAGSSLDVGATVTITVSEGTVPVVPVPNVVGKTQSAAAEQLQQSGFKVTAVKASSTSVASGTVAGQNPPAGVYVAKGATIQITVSQGPPPPDSVKVPDVVGRSESSATQVLKDAGFAVEAVDAYSDAVPAGTVLGQAPSAGLSSPKGATVTIGVSRGAAPGTSAPTT